MSTLLIFLNLHQMAHLISLLSLNTYNYRNKIQKQIKNKSRSKKPQTVRIMFQKKDRVFIILLLLKIEREMKKYNKKIK